MDATDERNVMSEQLTDVERKMQTFNVLQVAKEAFGGAEARLRELIMIMDPMDIVNYLKNQGWVENTKVVPPGGKVFSYGKNHEVVVFVPTDKEYIDYDDHMMAALEVIVDPAPVKATNQVLIPDDAGDTFLSE